MTMRLFTLMWFLTAGCAANTIYINNAFYNKSMIMFTREHEVINLYYEFSYTGDLYFIEADVVRGITTYRGLYVATDLEGDTFKLVKKVLDDGKDITSEGKTIYFGAKDGIYKYNIKEVKAEKYGDITEDIKCISKVHGSDELYILTENNQVFKVIQNGTRMIEVSSVVDAHEIVLDKANNLYYYSSDKKPWAISGDVAKEIKGLPDKPSFIRFVKPSKGLRNEVLVNVDNEVYRISSKGTSVKLDYEIIVRPSAVSIYGGFVIWYSHGKNIYVKPFYNTLDW